MSLSGWCSQRGRHPNPPTCRDPMCDCWCHDDEETRHNARSTPQPIDTLDVDPQLFG